jgi:GTP-binding protein HflX
VRDIAHPDTEAQKRDVIAVLADLGLDVEGDLPIIEALNKIDLLDGDAAATVRNRAARDSRLVAVSALSGEGTDDLLAAIDQQLAAGQRVYHYRLGPAHGADIAWLHRHGEVLDRHDGEDGVVRLTVRLDPADAERFGHRSEDLVPLSEDDRAAE